MRERPSPAHALDTSLSGMYLNPHANSVPEDVYVLLSGDTYLSGH